MDLDLDWYIEQVREAEEAVKIAIQLPHILDERLSKFLINGLEQKHKALASKMLRMLKQ